MSFSFSFSFLFPCCLFSLSFFSSPPNPFLFFKGVAHYLNYNTIGGVWSLGWGTLAGSTGHILSLLCVLIGTAAIDPVRRPNFNVFYITHHTFIIFYALLLAHGPVFWQYFLLPGTMYTAERLWREISARKLRTRVISVTNHPSDVVELQLRKKLFSYKPGQYLFLNCPYLSHWEWHPFTITSSPEEENVSVHIRAVGDWTKVFFFFLEEKRGEEKRGGKERKGKERKRKEREKKRKKKERNFSFLFFSDCHRIPGPQSQDCTPSRGNPGDALPNVWS